MITPTYPAANATFNSSHSTLAVVKYEISHAYEIVQVPGVRVLFWGGVRVIFWVGFGFSSRVLVCGVGGCFVTRGFVDRGFVALLCG